MAAYPSLDKVANRYRELAASLAPVKTGKLKTAIQAYNRPSGMIKKTSDGITISLDVSPPGAKYGKYWNAPNISYQVRNARTKNKDKINFAIKAQNSPELDSLIVSYIDGIIEKELIENIYEQIDKDLEPILAIK